MKKWIESWVANPSRDPRPAIINLLTSTGMMVLFIEVQVLVKNETGSNFQVGLVSSSYYLFSFLAGIVFGRLGDFVRRRAIIFAGCMIGGAGALTIALAPWDYSLVFLGRALTGVGMGMLPGALYATAHERKGSIGILTALGSLGWTIGSGIAALSASGPAGFFLTTATFILPALFASSFREKPERPRTKFLEFKVIERHWPIFLGFFLRHAGAMAIWVTFTLFLKSAGYSPFQIGLFYAVNSFGQVIFMLFMDRIKPRLTIPLGYLFSVFVFAAYVFVAPYKSLWLMIIIQIALAFSWSTLYLGSLLYLMNSCSEERSTTSGAFNAVSGLCGIAGALLGGWLATLHLNFKLAKHAFSWNYELSMVAAVILTIVGFLFALLGERRLFAKTQNTRESVVSYESVIRPRRLKP